MAIPQNLTSLTPFQFQRVVSKLSLGELSQANRMLKAQGLPQLGPSVTFDRFERDELVRRGRVFRASTLIAAVAAQASFVELFNPATSTVNLLVFAFMLLNNVGAATDALAGFGVNGAVRGGGVSFGGGLVRAVRNTGGSAELEDGYAAQLYAAKGDLRKGTSVNVFPQATEFEMWRQPAALAAGAASPLQKEGIGILAEVPPGQSFIIASGAVNVGLYASIEWGEIDPKVYP